MTETQIELSGSCRFTLTTYENIGHKDVCLDYTEHSPYGYYSDTETSIDIDADKAREIVAFMHKAFPEIEQPAQPAQQQQEPVAWAISYDGKTPYFLWTDGDGVLLDLEVKRQGGTTCKLPIYTSPPAQRKPLTDEQIRNIWSNGDCFEEIAFARAIEAAHGIKGDA